jgi:hypothetical protein
MGEKGFGLMMNERGSFGIPTLLALSISGHEIST